MLQMTAIRTTYLELFAAMSILYIIITRKYYDDVDRLPSGPAPEIGPPADIQITIIHVIAVYIMFNSQVPGGPTPL